MFQRRQKSTIIRTFKEWVQPRKGWRRRLHYLRHRMGRLSGSPHSIAAGFANGVAISFTPFVGFHLIGSWVMSLPMRANFVAAWIGTLVGNPFTFPFFWALGYGVGDAIISDELIDRIFIIDESPAKYHTFIDYMVKTGVGSIPFIFIAWFISYLLMKPVVVKYHEFRRQQRLEKIRKKHHPHFLHHKNPS